MKEIIPLLKELIKFQTVHSKPDEILRCAHFITTYLDQNGIRFKRFDQNGVPSILVTPCENRANILLMSHFDVVEGDAEQFSPYEADGRVYGRGALDDKYAVALSLVLLKENLLKLRSRGLGQEDLPFGILLTGDEEQGGMDGANKVLAEVHSNFCIALDGGTVEQIVTKEKGILVLKLIADGKSSHGSRPWLGENAIDKLINDYQTLRGFFTQTSPENWHRTINLSQISAGRSFNQVPNYAEATLDIRYTEDDDIDKLLKEMQKKIQGKLIPIRKDPMFLAEKCRFLDLITNANNSIQLKAEHGASDARFLSSHNINGIVWGANGDHSHHSENEYVIIESIYELYKKLNHFVQKTAEMN